MNNQCVEADIFLPTLDIDVLEGNLQAHFRQDTLVTGTKKVCDPCIIYINFRQPVCYQDVKLFVFTEFVIRQLKKQ